MDYSRNFYMFPLNRSEYEFKKAVELDNIEEVKKILDFSKFSGQKMVDFLLQKKYSKAALRFGRDENVQFGLALDCGDLDFAMKCAQKINDKSVWLKLGERAVELGFFDIAEKALILSENFFKLSFLYLVGDQKEKMEKLLQFAEKTENKALFLQISLFLNSENSLIKLLNNSGFSALAYAAIKAYNLNGEKFDIKIPAEVRNRIDRIRFGEGIKNCFSDKNGDLDKWPSKNKTVKNVNSEMEKILKSIETKTENLAKNEKMVENEFNDFQDWMAGLEKLEQAAEKVQRKEQSKLPAENQNSVNKNSQNLDKKLPKIGKKECLEFGQKWMENSPSAIDLISAQRFDLATERLYRKFGVVDPKPLQNLFLEIAQSTSMKMCLLPDFAPIRVGVSTRKKSFLKPLHGFNVEKVEREFDLALKKVTARKLEEAMADFKRILLILCVVEMSCDAEINVFFVDF
ncbi:hypothetical protein MHBO_002234 [Bonamia ostreae]|uniref:Uncharacterized protein n=1 Tax=Bonamia ostreae TaxID=126728 RepID=A0ABV2ALS9_9EUKA